METDGKNHQSSGAPLQSCKDKTGTKKYNFYRKPSIKKKAPEVKHTLTSYKRLLKANPLLKYEKDGIDVPLNKQHNLASGDNTSDKKQCSEKMSLQPNAHIERPQTNKLKRSQSVKNPEKACLPPKRKVNSISTGSKKLICRNESPTNISRQSNIDFNTSTSRLLSSTRLDNNFSKVVVKGKDTNRSLLNKNSVQKFGNTTSELCGKEKRKNKPIRRSLSAQHFDRKRGSSSIHQQKQVAQSDLTQSLEDVSKMNSIILQHGISPIAESSQETSIVFKTPSAYERRSIAHFTPKSGLSTRRSLYRGSSLPSLTDLQKRLNDWLLKRGKSLSSFHHLKCFGIQNIDKAIIDEENKENIEVNEGLDKGSYDDLLIDKAASNDNFPNKNNTVDENVENIAKVALEDLHKLIQDGYPVIQCEIWLELIRQKCKKLEEEPQYWECRAAIEQARGDITNAVQCYKTAIVQGAEVQSVDVSLDILLKKFSLLNITTESFNEDSSSDRARIVRDARNVFKSSIIQFAIQERKFKKHSQVVDEKKFIATPVRRSTRLSRSAYTSTPGMKICSSLQELDTSDREMLEFKKNKNIV